MKKTAASYRDGGGGHSRGRAGARGSGAEEPRKRRAGSDLGASGSSSSLLHGPSSSRLQRWRRSRRRASEKEPAASDQASRKKEPAAARRAERVSHQGKHRSIAGGRWICLTAERRRGGRLRSESPSPALALLFVVAAQYPSPFYGETCRFS